MFARSQAQPVLPVRGPLRMVRRPAHGQRVDVVKLADTPWPPVLVARSIFQDLAFAVPQSSRDGCVVSSRDKRQPSQAAAAADSVRSSRKLQYRPGGAP